mgnify:CR=1 FL=1
MGAHSYDELELCDEKGDVIYYRDYDYISMSHNKYDLRMITKKKFIGEASIWSSKLTAILKSILSYKTGKFIVIIPTVNISEEFYTKLNVISIQVRVNDNMFK